MTEAEVTAARTGVVLRMESYRPKPPESRLGRAMRVAAKLLEEQSLTASAEPDDDDEAAFVASLSPNDLQTYRFLTGAVDRCPAGCGCDQA